MESALRNQNLPSGFDGYEAVRTDLYVLLAALLGRSPSEDLLRILQHLDWGETLPEGLAQGLQALRQNGHRYPLAALQEEYDQLFVGLGCGEMIPYASWYKERRIHSLPLVSVRSDLISLGIVRQTGSQESEDHAAALCEVMALISRKSMGVPLTTQAEFFQEHLSWWMPNLFQDLQSAKRADFYRTVGLFGSRFVESEGQYLNFYTPRPFSIRKGGKTDETGI